MPGLVARLWSLIRRKQLVGKDNAGNLFYCQSVNVDGATKERRWVDYKGDPDPKNLPVEWYAWLIGRRKEAPTPEEIAALEAHRKLVKMNAAMVAKEEERRRFRSKSLQQDSFKDEMKPPDMGTFIKQVADLEGTKFDGGEGIFVDGDSGVAAITAPNDRKSNTHENSTPEENGFQQQNENLVTDRKEKTAIYQKWVPPN